MLFAFEIVKYGHESRIKTFNFYQIEDVLIVEFIFVILPVFQCNRSIVRLILFEAKNNIVFRIAAKHIAAHVYFG